MRLLKSLLCVFIGHKWECRPWVCRSCPITVPEAADTDGWCGHVTPEIGCERCGYNQ